MRSVLKQILLYLCLFLGVATLKAQHVEYGVALDTNYMMIGDQQHLTFKAKVDPGSIGRKIGTAHFYNECNRQQ